MNHSFSELKRTARLTLNNHYGIPMSAFLLTILISSVLLFPFRYLLNNSTLQIVLYYIAAFVIQLLVSVLDAGEVLLHLNMRRKKKYSVSTIFYYIKRQPDRFIKTSILLFGIVLLCMIPSILCSLPAIMRPNTSSYILMGFGFLISSVFVIIVQLKYALIVFLLIDYPTMNIREAFYTSRQLMHGQSLRLFLLYLSFIGWYILGICSLCIGFLWIIPYRQQTLIGFYSDCLSTMNMQQSKDNQTHNPDSTFETYC